MARSSFCHGEQERLIVLVSVVVPEIEFIATQEDGAVWNHTLKVRPSPLGRILKHTDRPDRG